MQNFAVIIRYLDDNVPVSMITKEVSSSVATSFAQTLFEGERENEEEDKDSMAKVKTRARAKEFAGTVVMVITAAEIVRTRSKTVRQRQCHGEASDTQ